MYILKSVKVLVVLWVPRYYRDSNNSYMGWIYRDRRR